MAEQKIVRGPHPQIMRDLAELLELRGHTCVMIVAGEEEYRFVWCQKDKCTDAVARAPMQAIAEAEAQTQLITVLRAIAEVGTEAQTQIRIDEIHQFEENLRRKGHICIQHPGPVLCWCGQEVCEDVVKIPEDGLQQLATIMGPYEFAAELARRGHVCVTYLKKIPPVVEWCEQPQCDRTKGG